MSDEGHDPVELYEALMTTRAMRRFTDEPVDDGLGRRGRDGCRPDVASVYPAVQSFVLACRSEGLGTVLTTVYRIHEDEVRAVCDIPDRYEVVALLPVGHPTGRWGVAPRRPASSLTSWNRFGERLA